jgi:hypothetical protein
MQRPKESKHVLNIKKKKENYVSQKIELLKLLSSYIKEGAKRDEIYTSLMKLKSSIS